MAFDPQQLAAFLIATSVAAGLNVYATVGTLGLLARAQMIALPPSLHPIAGWPVIGVCIGLFAIEAVADKVPAFDLIWNALQTFVKVPVGALLAYDAAAQLSPGWQIAAAAAGGVITLIAHGAKTAARVAVTPSPEPVSNFTLSVGEDAVAVFLTWLATRHPIVAGAIALALVVMIVAFARWMIRAIRLLLRRRQAAG